MGKLAISSVRLVHQVYAVLGMNMGTLSKSCEKSQLCICRIFTLISPVNATQSKFRKNERDTDPVTATYIYHVTAT